MTQPSHSMVEKIAGFFPESRWLQGYVRGKLRTDPAYPAVMELVGGARGPLLDIGCGLGLLAFFLREHGYCGPITGIDIDATKIARARAVAARHYQALTFIAGDAREAPGQVQTAVLLDVLHYLDAPAQRELLQSIITRMPPGGRAIIRNTPRDGSWRYRLTYLEELFVRAVRWIPLRAPICFPTIAELAAPFRAAGFAEEIRPLWGRTPFNSHLFVFTAPPNSQAEE